MKNMLSVLPDILSDVVWVGRHAEEVDMGFRAGLSVTKALSDKSKQLLDDVHLSKDLITKFRHLQLDIHEMTFLKMILFFRAPSGENSAGHLLQKREPSLSFWSKHRPH
ncbi:hypothetical protein RvY_08015 [Ramazzottius varieornatus]|uniref:Uncharacterized protein n=1 Tax=Ramazzottius varieornatus TaxID=947166 RepID=A0A1D1VA58_RAMVA|nr:hypothetical protein RvY_08015 [Ramazzottius varieornatus]